METNDSVLFEREFETFGRADFESMAHRTQARYNYPRALGFLDGKHVAMKKPAHSGSVYDNYKKFHSIILMTCCDCDYNIIAFDVGAPGRAGDARVFRDSDIKRWIAQNEHLFPETRELAKLARNRMALHYDMLYR
ncbi:hypothetical protein Aduo_006005 [Ancylostoma duodenale]